MNKKKVIASFMLSIGILFLSACESQTPVEKAFHNAAGLNKEQTAKTVQLLDSLDIKDIKTVTAYPSIYTNDEYAVSSDKYTDILIDFNKNKSVKKVSTNTEAVLYENKASGVIKPNKIEDVYVSKDEYNKFVNITIGLAKSRMKFPDTISPDYGSIQILKTKDKIGVSINISGKNSLNMDSLTNASAMYSYPDGNILEFYLDDKNG